MVYYEGRFINRLDKQFGDLFKEEFYKVKFKKARAIFYFAGVINITAGVELNFLGTWMRRTKSYYAMMEVVREAMRKVRLELE